MRYAAMLYLLVLTGCSSQAILINDKGEKRYCYKESTASIGSGAAATREFNRCLNDAGTAGFKRSE